MTMRTIHKLNTTLVTGILMLLVIGLFNNDTLKANAEARQEAKCLEMEKKGYVEEGSCACSEQLFDSWTKTYNIMDACGILEAKKRMEQ